MERRRPLVVPPDFVFGFVFVLDLDLCFLPRGCEDEDVESAGVGVVGVVVVAGLESEAEEDEGLVLVLGLDLDLGLGWVDFGLDVVGVGDVLFLREEGGIPEQEGESGTGAATLPQQLAWRRLKWRL